VAVLAVMLSGPASAQIGGRPIEVSGGAGIFAPDARARVKTGPAYQGALGWRVLPWIVLEGQATFGPSQADTAPNQDHNFMLAGLDLRWDLRPGYARAVPYLLFGAGYGLSHTTGHAPEKLERGAATLGLGLLQNVFDQRCYARLEARDIMFRERDQEEFSHHFAATVGLQWTLLGRERDQDLDKAKSLLKKAGQEGLTVDLMTADFAVGVLQAAQVFAQQAKGAGVTVNIKQVPVGTFSGPNYLQWTFAQDFWGYSPYLSQVAQGSLTTSPFNETHWNDAQYVSLYKQANATTDPATRKGLVEAMQKIDFDTGGYIIAAYNKLLDITTSRVHGFTPAGTGIVLGNADWAHAWMS